MGITVRHDPSAASMYRVARKAGEAEVMEQRRQEAIRQQQMDAELAARAAAQKAGFEFQKTQADLDREARNANREDVQAFEREGWAEQAKRAAQSQQAIEMRQAEAQARVAEQAQYDQLAEQMSKSGHMEDAHNFRGLVADAARKRTEIAKFEARGQDSEYADVLRGQLQEIEEKITGYTDGAGKYKMPTLDDTINEKIRWIPDPNDPTGRRKIAITVDQNGQLKGIQGLRQGGETQDPAAE